MNPEESRQLLSDCFDQAGHPGAAPLPENSEDWEAWSMIAQHLNTHEVAPVPENLSLQVQATIAQAAFRRDLVLVLQVAFLTGMVLTFVVASALGFDWLQRLHSLANSASAATALHNVIVGVWSNFPLMTILLKVAATAWKLAPIVLVSFAIFALLAEHTLLWFLRLGPFRPKTHIPSH